MKDPEGDAVRLGFVSTRNALRFSHAIAEVAGVYDAINKFYRVTVTEGMASFETHGNIKSSALDIEPDVAKGLKTKEGDVSQKGVSVGTLVKSRLWPCFVRRFEELGVESGEFSYGDGKRPLPAPISYIVIRSAELRGAGR